MRQRIRPPATVLLISLAIVSLLGIACEPPGQPPVSQEELHDIVRAEISSQIAAIDKNGPGDGDAIRAEIEVVLAEPLIELQGELGQLRNEFFGGDYASNLDIEGLRLDLEQVRALFDSLEFVIPEHIHEIVVSVVAHRLVMDPQARFSGITAENVVEEILQTIAVPA